MEQKRWVVCCDGTWQGQDNQEPTNVLKLHKAVAKRGLDDLPQESFYCQGLGADASGLEKLLQGAFGKGLDEHIIDAYRFLCNNYRAGDKICLFGFSRGAYTVRSLAGLLNTVGLVTQLNEDLLQEAYRLYRELDLLDMQRVIKRFRQQHSIAVEIEFLGCWDTVGALGIPDLLKDFSLEDLWNQRYEFHNTELSSIIRHARHAIALDETRRTYPVTPMKLSVEARASGVDLQEMWFVGGHSAIGGGKPEVRGLSAITLQWMVDECLNSGAGIAFHVLKLHSDPLENLRRDPNEKTRRRFYGQRNDIHSTVFTRMQQQRSYRPRSLQAYFPQPDPEPEPA